MTENKQNQQVNLAELYTQLSGKYNHKINVSSDKLTLGKGTQNLNDILAVVIKKDKFDHTNIFYSDTVNYIPVLIRCQKKSSFNVGRENDQVITLRGIYFIGSDTGMKECFIMNCNIIHDLYKLTEDGKKLNKTDMEIKMRDNRESEDEYKAYIQKLKTYIDESKVNPQSITITTTSPIDHNTFKIFTRDALLLLKDVVKTTVQVPGELLLGTAKIAAQIVFHRGGNIKKTRKNNTHIQKRNRRNNNSRRRRNYK